MKYKYYILVVLIWSQNIVFGQELPNTPEAALEAYIDMREGYKHGATKEFSRNEQFAMDDWCLAMDKKFPNTAETEYAWYLNNHFYSDASSRIKKAYDLDPTDQRIIRSLFGYYLMQQDLANAKMLLPMLVWSQNELNYYKDALPKTGLFVTSSEKDALPLYYLQLTEKIGGSVKIVCMDHLISESFRANQMKSYKGGINEFLGAENSYLKELMSSNADVYLSATVSQGYLTANENNIFLVGLSYQTNPPSQYEQLNTFWSKIAKKDWINLNLTNTQKRLYTNYLPPLLTLYKLKLAKGNDDPVLKKGIVALADKLSQTKNVEMILKSYD